MIDEGHKQRIIEQAGAKKIKNLPLINAAVVSVGSNEEKSLKEEKGVLRVDPDVIVSVSGKLAKPAPDPAPVQQTPWGINRIDAELVWSQNTGQGVKVAVLDTGIDLAHHDLVANIKGGYNTIKPHKSPADDNGHGTHVAGINLKSAPIEFPGYEQTGKVHTLYLGYLRPTNRSVILYYFTPKPVLK